MPYTITCRHHRSGHNGRHPKEWEDWSQSAAQLAVYLEELVVRMSPPLNEAEKVFARTLAAESARTGVAVVPGLASYHVVDIVDAPSDQAGTMDHSDQVDWVAVGCLARRLQQQAIDLNHTAAVAPAHDPDFDAPGRARATINDLVELCVALHTHLLKAS
jgi:hypothetical protein